MPSKSRLPDCSSVAPSTSPQTTDVHASDAAETSLLTRRPYPIDTLILNVLLTCVKMADSIDDATKEVLPPNFSTMRQRQC